MKSKQELYQLFNSYTLGVLSTVNPEGQPNAALIGFGQTNSLELIFGTSTTSRKYKNIMANAHIAFAIGGQTSETVQYEGIARELDESELDIVRLQYWPKNPFAEKAFKAPTGSYFIVQPSWIRYTDIQTRPWDITEIKF